MDRTPDQCRDALLMLDAAEGINDVATALLAMHEQWRAAGAPEHALKWISDLATTLGWWSGRLTGAGARSRGPVTSAGCNRRRYR